MGYYYVPRNQQDNSYARLWDDERIIATAQAAADDYQAHPGVSVGVVCARKLRTMSEEYETEIIALRERISHLEAQVNRYADDEAQTLADYGDEIAQLPD